MLIPLSGSRNHPSARALASFANYSFSLKTNNLTCKNGFVLNISLLLHLMGNSCLRGRLCLDCRFPGRFVRSFPAQVRQVLLVFAIVLEYVGVRQEFVRNL